MDTKKIVYIDMDGVIVDFNSGVEKLTPELRQTYEGKYKNIPGIFSTMEPMPNAIEAVKKLSRAYDIYILSTAPWDNSSAWSGKVEWLKKYFGSDDNSAICMRLILTHRKDLNRGDILIDDSTRNGASEFQGEFIHFGSAKYPDWQAVLKHLNLA